MDKRNLSAVGKILRGNYVMCRQRQENVTVSGLAVDIILCRVESAVKNMDIKVVAFLCGYAPRLLRYAAAFCPVYRFTVCFKPFADCLKTFQCLFR